MNTENIIVLMLTFRQGSGEKETERGREKRGECCTDWKSGLYALTRSSCKLLLTVTALTALSHMKMSWRITMKLCAVWGQRGSCGLCLNKDRSQWRRKVNSLINWKQHTRTHTQSMSVQWSLPGCDFYSCPNPSFVRVYLRTDVCLFWRWTPGTYRNYRRQRSELTLL